jgi:hypothetical protein
LPPLADDGRAFGCRLLHDRERGIGAGVEIHRGGRVGSESERAARHYRLSVGLHQIDDVGFAAEIGARGRIVAAVIDQLEDVLDVVRWIALIERGKRARHRELRFGDVTLGVGGGIALRRGLRGERRRGKNSDGDGRRNSVHNSFHQGSPCIQGWVGCLARAEAENAVR